ncbi:MAG: FAD binding domain-containing protein [Planctomycetes bacterium]|nr:FAD binding domain-containing protein [Planctomycetota bacterium]
MLRLPKFEVLKPTSVEETVDLIRSLDGETRFIAGGTDLNPNMKHRLFTPDYVIALGGVAELHGIQIAADGSMRIGAMTTLTNVNEATEIASRYPALAQAAGLVSGPQLRNMGTLGGNVMLDTRCQWYNQTYFWRKALGFCMKKDGTVCHVVEGGSKCVAAASNDSAPVLITLNAELEFASAPSSLMTFGSSGSDGSVTRKHIPIADLYKADGIWNKNVAPTDLLVAIHIPAPSANHRSAYSKLRDRGSIDFPLFGIAVRLDLDDNNTITDAAVCAVALQARPWPLKKAASLLIGKTVGSNEYSEAVELVAALAAKQCRPMPNIPGDHEYRHAMVPVFTRRAFRAIAAQ